MPYRQLIERLITDLFAVLIQYAARKVPTMIGRTRQHIRPLPAIFSLNRRLTRGRLTDRRQPDPNPGRAREADLYSSRPPFSFSI